MPKPFLTNLLLVSPRSPNSAYQNPLAGCSPFPRFQQPSNDIEMRAFSRPAATKSDSFFMPLDESPTKMTFMSEDDLVQGLNSFGSRRLGIDFFFSKKLI